MSSLRAALALREATSVVTSGYMTKKGKRRFFVIEDDQLKWYTSSKLSKAEFKGCLQLATCRLSSEPATRTVILDSTTAAKSYPLATSSPDEFRHWLQASRFFLRQQIIFITIIIALSFGCVMF